jgi:hypothetical protein
MWLILIVVLVIVCIGGLPQFGFHQGGYAPSGIGFVIVIVLLILLLTGRL